MIAYDPFVNFSDFAEMIPNVEDVLAQADYISMHMPLIDSTKGFLNKDRLAKMKDGAYIVNTGRGKTVVEEDVAEALKSGKLAGFATDVWYSDPPDWNTPLLSAPNTLFAPHIGASSKENMLRIGVIVDNLIGQYVAAK